MDHQVETEEKWGNFNERNKGQLQTSFITCGAMVVLAIEAGRHIAVVFTVRCGNIDDI